MTAPRGAVLQRLITGPTLVSRVLWYDRIGSTNAEVARRAAGGAGAGLLVLADEQTAGRGRQGRRWSAPPGTSLMGSLLLRTDRAPAQLALLPLLTGLAQPTDAEEPERRRYGLGVAIVETDLGLTYGHSGFFPGYNSRVAYFPEYGIAVAIQINTDRAELDRQLGRAFDFVREAEAGGLVDPYVGPTRRTVRLRLGRQHVEVVEFDTPGATISADGPDTRFQHIAMVAPSMAVAVRRRGGVAGWTPITRGGPQTLPPNTGSVTAFKFRDPEGHPLELISFPEGVGDPQWQQGGAGVRGYDHTAISVMDVERSRAFYTEMLGFHVGGTSLNTGPEQDRLDGLPDCKVDVVALQPSAARTPHVELLHYRTPPGRTLAAEVKANDVASTRQIHKVDDLGGLVGRLEAAGVPFVSPGIVTLKNGGKAAAVRDPDGHMIVFMA